MKKLLALLLTLVLCISASVTVFAANPAITANDVEAERGDIVYVAIELSDCAQANTLAVEFDYDTTVLKKVVAKCAWSKEADLSDFEVTKNRGSWYVEDATDLNGEICKLAFQVKADAPIEETEVSCKVVVKNEDTVIGTYTTTATVDVICTHVAADDAKGEKVDDTNHKYDCVHCGTDILEAHIWDNGKVTKVATETETGIRTYTCTYCGATKEEVIPKLEVEDDDQDDTGSGDEGGSGSGDEGGSGSGDEGGSGSGDEGGSGSGDQGGSGSGDQGGSGSDDQGSANKPESNKPESNKPATKPESTDKDETTTIPETEDTTSAVEIEETVVKETVTEIQNAEEGKEVVVEMKQEDGKVATVVPVEILEAVKGKDVDVVLDMGDYSWTINGKDVAAEGLKDINLQVALDTNAVKEAVVKELAGEDAVRQISLKHNGEFNFKAKLTINVGKDNAGKFGNLYYHNNGKLEFMGAAEVDENGDVALGFEHASDYVLVVGRDRTAEEQSQDPSTDVDVPSTEDAGNEEQPKDNGNVGTVVGVIVVIVLIAVLAFVFLKKKK